MGRVTITGMEVFRTAATMYDLDHALLVVLMNKGAPITKTLSNVDLDYENYEFSTHKSSDDLTTVTWRKK